MILGVLDHDRRGDELKPVLLAAASKTHRGENPASPSCWTGDHLALCSAPLGVQTLDEFPQPFTNERRNLVAVFQGKIYNRAEIAALLGPTVTPKTGFSGELLVLLYEKFGKRFLDKVNGTFAFALWDTENRTLLLGRDRLGIEPLFYAHDGSRLMFGTSLRSLTAPGLADAQLNPDGVMQYLLYCYNPAIETLMRGIRKLPPGHVLTFGPMGLALESYWHLSYAETIVKTAAEYCEEILGLIKDAIRLRLDPQRTPSVLLSGGTDSSAITSIASTLSPEPVNTFSFRCEGKSFDESHYARLIAQRYHTNHTEVPYPPDSIELMSEAVETMDDPFCDLGIEIATFIMGRAARGKASYVMSGEGGDELFAGHPVYTADLIAQTVDWIPGKILSPVLQLMQKLPDSDQKKDWRVKLKRSAYGLSFPPELMSHRWRIYYTPGELRELCTDEFLGQCRLDRLYEPVLKYNREADGKDLISRILYTDYHTLVSFYLQRLQLLRASSLESRLPLMDHRLVEYAAKIPSKQKIRGLSETKYIYRKALEAVLPREILYDRPKLGHSVPMKNWLRDNARTTKWIGEVLHDGALERRGLFRKDFIERLLNEHARKTHNHSHRIWGLAVLSLWLQRLS